MYNIDNNISQKTSKTDKFDIEPNDTIMLTLTLADTKLNCMGTITKVGQDAHLEPINRMKSTKFTYDKLNIQISPFFKSFKSTTEISPCLNSQGQKHYARIHVHLVGEVIDPIGLLLQLGYIVNVENCGYHIARLKTKKQIEEKQKYIIKDANKWDAFNKSLSICKNIFNPYRVKTILQKFTGYKKNKSKLKFTDLENGGE